MNETEMEVMLRRTLKKIQKRTVMRAIKAWDQKNRKGKK